MTSTPRTITHEEIRKGDKITTTYTEGDVTFTVTGVAHNQDWEKDWRTEESIYVSIKDWDATQITLLERAGESFPTEFGSVIVAKKVRGTEGNFTLFLQDDGYGGEWRSTSSIEDVQYGGNYIWHPAERIEDWVPAKVLTF